MTGRDRDRQGTDSSWKRFVRGAILRKNGPSEIRSIYINLEKEKMK